MQACPACAQEWERRRQLQAMLGCFRGQAPDFPAEVIRRLRTEEAARRRRQWVRMGAAAAACVVLVLGTLFGRQHSKEIARDVAEPACYAADEGRPLDEMEQEAVICMTAADRDWIADALAKCGYPLSGCNGIYAGAGGGSLAARRLRLCREPAGAPAAAGICAAGRGGGGSFVHRRRITGREIGRAA